MPFIKIYFLLFHIIRHSVKRSHSNGQRSGDRSSAAHRSGWRIFKGPQKVFQKRRRIYAKTQRETTFRLNQKPLLPTLKIHNTLHAKYHEPHNKNKKPLALRILNILLISYLVSQSPAPISRSKHNYNVIWKLISNFLFASHTHLDIIRPSAIWDTHLRPLKRNDGQNIRWHYRKYIEIHILNGLRHTLCFGFGNLLGMGIMNCIACQYFK